MRSRSSKPCGKRVENCVNAGGASAVGLMSSVALRRRGGRGVGALSLPFGAASTSASCSIRFCSVNATEPLPWLVALRHDWDLVTMPADEWEGRGVVDLLTGPGCPSRKRLTFSISAVGFQLSAAACAALNVQLIACVTGSERSSSSAAFGLGRWPSRSL
jgi:hypothetical protein